MWSKTNQLIADCDASATMWTYVTISLLPVWIPIARMLIDPEDETKLGTRQQSLAHLYQLQPVQYILPAVVCIIVSYPE